MSKHLRISVLYICDMDASRIKYFIKFTFQYTSIIGQGSTIIQQFRTYSQICSSQIIARNEQNLW